MEDVGKTPEAHETPPAPVEGPSISSLDGWIENLMSCKQLPESDVQKLCDKVLSAAAKFFLYFPAVAGLGSQPLMLIIAIGA